MSSQSPKAKSIVLFGLTFQNNTTDWLKNEPTDSIAHSASNSTQNELWSGYSSWTKTVTVCIGSCETTAVTVNKQTKKQTNKKTREWHTAPRTKVNHSHDKDRIVATRGVGEAQASVLLLSLCRGFQETVLNDRSSIVLFIILIHTIEEKNCFSEQGPWD